MWKDILKTTDWEHSIRGKDLEDNVDDLSRHLEGFKGKEPTDEQKTQWAKQANKSLTDLDEIEKIIKEHDFVFFPEIGQMPLLDAIKKLKDRINEIIKDVTE